MTAKELSDARCFLHTTASIMVGIEFEIALVRVVSDIEFVITKGSSFRFDAYYIERNCQSSIFLAECAL